MIKQSLLILLLTLFLVLCACGNPGTISTDTPSATQASAETAPGTSTEPISTREQAPEPEPQQTPESVPHSGQESEPTPQPPRTQESAPPSEQMPDKSATAAPQETSYDTVYTCTLSVRCDTLLDNLSALDPDKLELVPADGVLFPATAVEFYDGESVFNVLQREMKKAKIHMEHRSTPAYNSAYILGIGNLYELDCGELSGWLYRVGGSFPSYGPSRYQLSDGDVVEWLYSCDLGRDLGEYQLEGRQE